MYRKILRTDKRCRRKLVILLGFLVLMLLIAFYHSNDSPTRRMKEQPFTEGGKSAWEPEDSGLAGSIKSTNVHSFSRNFIPKSKVSFRKSSLLHEDLLLDHKINSLNLSAPHQNITTTRKERTSWIDNLASKIGSEMYSSSYEERKKDICGQKWQEEYTKLHRDILQSRRARKFIVYSCNEKAPGYGCAGYGNRLGAMTSLLFLSVLTQRAFLIEWSHGEPLEFYLHPKGIEWNYSIADLKDLDTRKHYWGKRNRLKPTSSDILRQADNFPDFTGWFKQTDFRTYFDHPVEKVTGIWYFANSLWKHSFLAKFAKDLDIETRGSHESLIGCAFDFLFQKSKALETRFDAAKRSLGLTSMVPKLGLHVRMGDFSFGRKVHFNTMNFESFFVCAHALGKALARQRPGLVTKRNLKWFLATDDNEIKTYALQNYPENVVTLNITPRHLSQLKERNAQSNDGMYGMLLDHLILSECDFLILSKSTFGKTASGLSFRSNDTSYTIGEECGEILKGTLTI